MTYTIHRSSIFKRDIKIAKKRRYHLDKLKKIISLLAQEKSLPAHHRECHIAPDWLLIYCIKRDTNTLELVRTGTHSDLFNK